MKAAGRDPCRPPGDLLPTLSRAGAIVVARPHLPMPETLRAGNIVGCAGVKFRLTPDGAPTDVSLVTEAPPGLGLGDFVVREILATRFERPAAATGWYYEVHRFRAP